MINMPRYITIASYLFPTIILDRSYTTWQVKLKYCKLSFKGKKGTTSIKIA